MLPEVKVTSSTRNRVSSDASKVGRRRSNRSLSIELRNKRSPSVPAPKSKRMSSCKPRDDEDGFEDPPVFKRAAFLKTASPKMADFLKKQPVRFKAIKNSFGTYPELWLEPFLRYLPPYIDIETLRDVNVKWETVVTNFQRRQNYEEKKGSKIHVTENKADIGIFDGIRPINIDVLIKTKADIEEKKLSNPVMIVAEGVTEKANSDKAFLKLMNKFGLTDEQKEHVQHLTITSDLSNEKIEPAVRSLTSLRGLVLRKQSTAGPKPLRIGLLMACVKKIKTLRVHYTVKSKVLDMNDLMKRIDYEQDNIDIFFESLIFERDDIVTTYSNIEDLLEIIDDRCSNRIVQLTHPGINRQMLSTLAETFTPPNYVFHMSTTFHLSIIKPEWTN